MKEDQLLQDSIPQLVKYIAIPASVGMFFKTMYNVVDTYFAGLLSTTAQSALSISFPVFFAIIAFSAGTATAATVLVASEKGRGNEKRSRMYAKQILSFSILCGILLSAFGLVFSPALFGFLGADGVYLATALSYMNILYVGASVFVLSFALNGILNAVGDTISFRNMLIAGFVANLLLSPALMFGWWIFPEMGLSGVAVATVVIEFFGAVYLFYQAQKKQLFGQLRISDFVPQSQYFGSIIYQGLPGSFAMMATGVGIFVITYFVSIYGQAAVAAYGIATRIEQIFLLPMVGINIAATTLISQNLSAGNRARVQEAIATCYRYGFLIMLLGTAVIFVFARYFLDLFSDDVQVIESGVPYLKIAAFATCAYAIHFMSDAILRGMKKPMIPLWMSVVRQVVVPLGVFYYVVRVLDLGAVYLWWSIFGIVWIFAFIYLAIVYKVTQEK